MDEKKERIFLTKKKTGRKQKGAKNENDCFPTSPISIKNKKLKGSSLLFCVATCRKTKNKKIECAKTKWSSSADVKIATKMEILFYLDKCKNKLLVTFHLIYIEYFDNTLAKYKLYCNSRLCIGHTRDSFHSSESGYCSFPSE